MRVAVLGSGTLGVPILAAIAASRHCLAGVVSTPDRPHGRRHILVPSPMSQWARNAGVPLLQPARVSDPDFEPQFMSLGAEVSLVADFGEILDPMVFAWTPRGAYGVHPSLLPRWRGAAPIPWTIMAGDSTTGVTAFRVSASVDAGHVAGLVELPVDARETAITLKERLADAGAALALTVLDRLERDELTLQPQPSQGLTRAPKLKRSNGILRWNEDAVVLDRRVRGLLPWPCAWFPFEEREVKVLRSYPLPVAHGQPPGTVQGIRELEGVGAGVAVACGSGELLLLEVQAPGRRPLPAAPWLHGTRIQPGACLLVPQAAETGDVRA